MKTYEEMAQNALRRGRAVRKRENRRKKIAFGAASAVLVCCFAAAVLFGFRGAETKGPLNYGTVQYLSVADKASNGISGQAYQCVGAQSDTAQSAPPDFLFEVLEINVVAKAVEEYPGVYESLTEYGFTSSGEYRLFRMEVIDPLDSAMEGSFLYMLPQYLKGDLTQYDALLISLKQCPKNYVLRCDDRLVTFEYLFCDPCGTPQLGNIIAFTDGVFDESLWQDESWIYGYQFARSQLDKTDNYLLVYRGATLEEALRRRLVQIDEWGQWAQTVQVKHFDFQTEAAQAAMDYLTPFDNGVFVPRLYSHNYLYYRYINGCPTNEWVYIHEEDETVTTSLYRFEDGDFENLPDLSTYVASLDLSKILPQHTDAAGKMLIYNSAAGWYEKTESGVYSLVRIQWLYIDADMEYYDETFILLDETGDHIISREELVERIGQNRNISNKEYGVGVPRPLL